MDTKPFSKPDFEAVLEHYREALAMVEQAANTLLSDYLLPVTNAYVALRDEPSVSWASMEEREEISLTAARRCLVKQHTYRIEPGIKPINWIDKVTQNVAWDEYDRIIHKRNRTQSLDAFLGSDPDSERTLHDLLPAPAVRPKDARTVEQLESTSEMHRLAIRLLLDKGLSKTKVVLALCNRFNLTREAAHAFLEDMAETLRNSSMQPVAQREIRRNFGAQ